MEVEVHNLDHGVFRSWCPHCVKGRAESYGHVRKVQGEGDVPTMGLDYTANKRRRKRKVCR